jgi:hypothetical protein
MKLPIELRLQVYRELLLQPESEGDLRMKSSGLHCLHPNILQTCHQVYDEAVEVLYGENVFYINDIDPDNRNAPRVKHVIAYVFSSIDGSTPNKRQLMVLTDFLHARPDLTHLFLNFGWDFEEEAVQTAVEGLLQRHNGLIDLDVCVHAPLTPKGIAFSWRLYSILKQNRQKRDGARSAEETTGELYDTTTCPPFVKYIPMLPEGM